LLMSSFRPAVSSSSLRTLDGHHSKCRPDRSPGLFVRPEAPQGSRRTPRRLRLPRWLLKAADRLPRFRGRPHPRQKPRRRRAPVGTDRRGSQPPALISPSSWPAPSRRNEQQFEDSRPSPRTSAAKAASSPVTAISGPTAISQAGLLASAVDQPASRSATAHPDGRANRTKPSPGCCALAQQVGGCQELTHRHQLTAVDHQRAHRRRLNGPAAPHCARNWGREG